MFFFKKRQKEIEKMTDKLEASHLRQVSKIERTTENVRHITEAIAHATGALRR